jgi:polyisoprenoid-binding protein YceI
MATATAVAPQVLETVPTGQWDVDPVHSSIEFHVTNMGLVNVKGFFGDFEGSLEAGEDGALRGHGKVDVASVHTRSEKRDEHLRSPDFFDVENHPEATFESTRIESRGGGRYLVLGDLTIKGVTKQVELDAEIAGVVEDPWGGERVGVSATTNIDRRDFDLNWDQATPAGIPLASNRVTLEINLGAVRRTQD